MLRRANKSEGEKNILDAPSVVNIQPAKEQVDKTRIENKQPPQGMQQKFSNDKTKIADVFELPITVVNNVLY